MNPAPELQIRAYSIEKEGNSPEEYEDAWAMDDSRQRVAIADGASDAFEARLWAEALVSTFVQEPPPRPSADALLAWLERPALIWREGIDWEDLRYYHEEKARRGSFAAFLGAVFSIPGPDQAGGRLPRGEVARYTAVAVGDSCLFHVRGGELVTHFPVEKTSDFGTTPLLLSTIMAHNRVVLERPIVRCGYLRPGDRLYLATDALSAWFLGRVEAGEPPWPVVEEMTSEVFGELVSQLRQEGLRNDDCTLLVLRVERGRRRRLGLELPRIRFSFRPDAPPRGGRE
jgi:hypothetical protein